MIAMVSDWCAITKSNKKRKQTTRTRRQRAKILGQKKEKQARREFQIKNSIPDFLLFFK